MTRDRYEMAYPNCYSDESEYEEVEEEKIPKKKPEKKEERDKPKIKWSSEMWTSKDPSAAYTTKFLKDRYVLDLEACITVRYFPGKIFSLVLTKSIRFPFISNKFCCGNYCTNMIQRYANSIHCLVNHFEIYKVKIIK